MIFVTVGSREYPFDRLLIELDRLVENGEIQDEIFAQIGQSNYFPKNFNFTRFLGADDFLNYQKAASLIISHGGTGALIGALKLSKNVIATPRLSKYKEHTDDHQLQVSSVLEQEGYLRVVIDMDNLGEVYKQAILNPIIKEYNRPSNVFEIINNFIKEN